MIDIPIRAFDLPCGGRAHHDHDSTCHLFRCSICFMVVGSVGMPSHCAKLLEEERNSKNE